MWRVVTLVAFVLVTTSPWAVPPDARAEETVTAKPESLRDRSSYAFGVNLVAMAQKNAIELNQDYFIKGVQDAVAGRDLLMTADEMRAALQEQQKAQVAKRQAWASAIGVKNKAETEAFLDANKDRDGVTVTASGLQYKIMKAGEGPKPMATDTVEMHYRGKLLGGPEFETTYGGSPQRVPIPGVIKGLQEGLQLMPVGSHWKLWIPPGLAYGDTGKGGIGPHATLVFEVELLGIDEGEAGGDKGPG